MQSKVCLEIVGLIKDSSFQVAKWIAEALKYKFPDAFLEPKIQPLLELEWVSYLQDKKKELRGEVWQYSSNLMCFLDGSLLGDEKSLSSWAKKEWSFTSRRRKAYYQDLAEDEYIKYLQKTGHQFVYMDIDLAGEAGGRLLFELFTDICPKTSKNFEALCTGEEGVSDSGLPLCYKGSLIHRVVPSGWVQGGDISPGSRGNGGESIYGPVFEDESFSISHSRKGMLGMANKGAHTNASQFYITLQPTSWMDLAYVAFGQLIEGVDVLKRLEEIPTSNERPKFDCKVSDCGIFKLEKQTRVELPVEPKVEEKVEQTEDQTEEQTVEDTVEQTVQQTVEQTEGQTEEQTEGDSVDQTVEQTEQQTEEQTEEKTEEQTVAPMEPSV